MSRAMKPSGIEWIGDIPEGWEIVRLKNIALLNPFNNKSFEDGTMISFSPMEYIGQGKMDTLAIEIEKVKNGYTFFANDDVIMAKVTPCFENGNIAIAKNLLNGVGYGSSELYVFRCTKASNIFLFYFLQNNTFKNKCTTSMYGAGGLKRVPLDFIKSYKLALPSLPEQQAIADYLDRKCELIDSTIEKQKIAIEKLKLYKQSVITETVIKGLDPFVPMKPSGIEWIGEIPQHWVLSKLKHVSQFKNGLAHEKEVDQVGKYVVVNSKFVSTGGSIRFFCDEQIMPLFKNDICIVLSDVPNGRAYAKCFVIDKNDTYTLNQRVGCFFNIKIDLRFFFYYINRNYGLLKYDDGINQTNLRKPDLLNLDFVLPLPNEQQAIADYLDQKCSQIDQAIELKQKLIEKLSNYKKSLIYECVTGKREVTTA